MSKLKFWLDIWLQVWQCENTQREFVKFRGWCFTKWRIFECNKKYRSGDCFFWELAFSSISLCCFFFIQLQNLLYVFCAPEVCSILSPSDLWSCNYCRQFCLHLQGNDSIFICGYECICLFCVCIYIYITNSPNFNILHYPAFYFLLLDKLSHCYKICIDKASLFYYTKWAWGFTAWLP